MKKRTKEQIILIGGGGHCKVVIDAIRCGNKYNIKGIVDRDLKKGSKVLGVTVLGGDDILEKVKVKNVFISVGSVGDCSKRKELYKKIIDMKRFNVPFIIHPKAVIAKDVKIGKGTFVAASVTINPGTKIGKNAIINTSSSIDHDCEIGDFVHIAPGVTLSGGVRVEEEIHVGVGANIAQNANLTKTDVKASGSKNNLVKAGSVIFRSEDGRTNIVDVIRYISTGDKEIG